MPGSLTSGKDTVVTARNRATGAAAAGPATVASTGRRAAALVASVDVTTPSGAHPEDDFWRRPTPDRPTTGNAAEPVPDFPERPIAGNSGEPGTDLPEQPRNGIPAGGPAVPRVDGHRDRAEPGQPVSPWSRPAQPDPGSGAGQPGGTGQGRAAGGYAGPPPTTPPPAGWRPPVHVQVPPPRRLPPQDMTAMDNAEQQSQRLTYGVGAVAGIVLVILICLLCSRVLF
jgi:hypothetical protein